MRVEHNQPLKNGEKYPVTLETGNQQKQEGSLKIKRSNIEICGIKNDLLLKGGGVILSGSYVEKIGLESFVLLEAVKIRMFS